MYTPGVFFSFLPTPLNENTVLAAEPADEVSMVPIPRELTRPLTLPTGVLGPFAPEFVRAGGGGGDVFFVAAGGE